MYQNTIRRRGDTITKWQRLDRKECLQSTFNSTNSVTIADTKWYK